MKNKKDAGLKKFKYFGFWLLCGFLYLVVVVEAYKKNASFTEKTIEMLINSIPITIGIAFAIFATRKSNR